MKKITFNFILFFFNLVICIAQPLNNEQRLIGTWIDKNDSSSIWTFNSNGKLNINEVNVSYIVDKDEIIMFMIEVHPIQTIIWKFVLHDDDTLILSYYENFNKSSFLYLDRYIKIIYLIKKDA
jgi:hypothetical protein